MINYKNRPSLASERSLEWKTLFIKGEFSLYLHKKCIFHFQSAKNDFFCEAATKDMSKKCTTPIFTHSRPYCMGNSSIGCISKAFKALLIIYTTFCRFSWKRAKFELQVLHGLLLIFSKNHFELHKFSFNGRSN